MALRAAGRDDHRVAERCLARQVDADDVVSLGVIERIDDEVGERDGSRGGAFCAARFEFGELLMQNVRPQRKNPLLYCSDYASGSTLRQEKCASELLNFQDSLLERRRAMKKVLRRIIELEEAATRCLSLT
jgi:hypothetical protein